MVHLHLHFTPFIGHLFNSPWLEAPFNYKFEEVDIPLRQMTPTEFWKPLENGFFQIGWEDICGEL